MFGKDYTLPLKFTRDGHEEEEEDRQLTLENENGNDNCLNCSETRLNPEPETVVTLMAY